MHNILVPQAFESWICRITVLSNNCLIKALKFDIIFLNISRSESQKSYQTFLYNSSTAGRVVLIIVI